MSSSRRTHPRCCRSCCRSSARPKRSSSTRSARRQVRCRHEQTGRSLAAFEFDLPSARTSSVGSGRLSVGRAASMRGTADVAARVKPTRGSRDALTGRDQARVDPSSDHRGWDVRVRRVGDGRSALDRERVFVERGADELRSGYRITARDQGSICDLRLASSSAVDASRVVRRGGQARVVPWRRRSAHRPDLSVTEIVRTPPESRSPHDPMLACTVDRTICPNRLPLLPLGCEPFDGDSGYS